MKSSLEEGKIVVGGRNLIPKLKMVDSHKSAPKAASLASKTVDVFMQNQTSTSVHDGSQVLNEYLSYILFHL
jgi:hypothetical protein